MSRTAQEILEQHKKWYYDYGKGKRLVWSDLTDEERAVLSGAVLSGAVLRRAVLSGAVLRRAVLSGAVLSGADLSGAVLSGADLRRADLSDAVLSGADLRRAVLSGAVLSGAVLSGADLSGAVLSGADLRRAVLSGADLRRAVLSDAVLSGADLSDADLSGAVLRRAVLSGADLRRAVLSGAVLRRAVLSGAVLSETCLDPKLRDYQHKFAKMCPPNKHGGRFVYRTATSQHIGNNEYKPGHTYIAPVFSFDCVTACHPGIYAASLEWMRSEYPIDKLVRCYVRDGDWVISAKGAIRCKRLRVLGYVEG